MLLTTAQAGERIGITAARVKKLIESGTLPATFNETNTHRKCYRLDEQAVLAYKKSLRTLPPAEDRASMIINGAVVAGGPPAGFVDAREAKRLTGAADGTLYGRVRRGTLDKVSVNGRAYFRASQLTPPNPKYSVRQHARGTEATASPSTVGLVARLARIDNDIADLKDIVQKLIVALGGIE